MLQEIIGRVATGDWITSAARPRIPISLRRRT